MVKVEYTEARQPPKLIHSIILGILYILISSDIFVDSVLSNFSGTTVGHDPTTVGVLIQSVTLVIVFSLIVYFF